MQTSPKTSSGFENLNFVIWGFTLISTGSLNVNKSEYPIITENTSECDGSQEYFSDTHNEIQDEDWL